MIYKLYQNIFIKAKRKAGDRCFTAPPPQPKETGKDMEYKDLAFMIWMENQEKKERCIYAETCGDSHDCVSCPHYCPADGNT